MLTTYFDESGTHRDSAAFVVAGLIAPQDQWARLSKEWRRELLKHGLAHFHAVDCVHGRKLFKGMPKEERDELLDRLAQITARYACWRVWTVVIMKDFRSVFSGLAEDKLYQMCAWGCSAGIRYLAERRSTPVDCEFAKGGKGGGRAFVHFKRNAEFYRLGSVNDPDDVQEQPPLQAADLHAYEVHRYFSERLRQSGRSMRRSFSKLLEIQQAGEAGYVYDEENIRVFVEAAKNQQSPIPLRAYRLDVETRDSMRG